MVGIHTPRNVTKVEEHHIADLALQMRDMIPTLETVSGNKFDIDRFREVVALSSKCSGLWKEVLETGTVKPAPMTFFDGTIHIGPAVVLRGTQEAVDYYTLLLEELHQRIENQVGAIDDEKHRLYWDGMPVWGKLRDLSDLFMRLRTNVVASTYCNSWIFDAFDPREPFESSARAYTELFVVRADSYKEAYLEEWTSRFSVDGVVFHDVKTCPANTNSRYGMPQRLSEKLGIPNIVINGDHNDLRCFSEEQTKTNIEAFVEQLEEKRTLVA
jgi:benzoyl-CoA reductase/2-hydroxyglutaryl-CoA dehydratase subunit BcrC/BadD/HgdB